MHDLIPFQRAIGISRVESILLKERLTPTTWEILVTGRISKFGEEDWHGSILGQLIFCLLEDFFIYQVLEWSLFGQDGVLLWELWLLWVISNLVISSIPGLTVPVYKVSVKGIGLASHCRFIPSSSKFLLKRKAGIWKVCF